MSPTRVKRTSAIWLLIVFGVALGLVWFLTGTWGQSAAANPSPSLVPVVDPEPVGHLGGATEAVFISGTLAYVGNGSELTIMDITDPTDPTEIGAIWWKEGVSDITVRGSYAYVAVANGLRIVDISNPVSPTLVGSYIIASPVFSLALHDAQVYLGTRTGMQIVDIANPANPVLLGAYVYNVSYGKVDVVSVEEYVYIALTYSYTTHVVDVTNPTLPTQVGEYDYGGKMSVVGDRLYMAASDWGMRILDVSHPDTPVELGFFIPPSDPPYWYPLTRSVKVVGNLAYISYIASSPDPHYLSAWRLSIANVMTPSAPVQVVDTSLPASVPSYYSTDFEVVDDYAWAAVGRGGLLTFDLHEPITPTLVSHVGVSPLSPVVVQNQFAYGLGIAEDLDYPVFYVIDLTDPARPQARGLLSIYTDGGLSGLWIKDSYAYTFSRSRDLDYVKIIDISDPDHPVMAGSYTYPDPQTAGPSTLGSNLAFKGNYLYVGNWGHGGNSTIDIVDISDPTAPVRVGAVNTDRMCCLQVVGNYLYAEEDIYDISNPLSPVLVGTDPNNFNLGGLLVQNNRAYLADYESWHIFDVTNPVNPVLLSTWSIPSPPNYPTLALWGNDLFLSHQTVSLLDVSDATNPVVKAIWFPIGGAPAVGGATIVLSNWNGLYVFDALSFLSERTYLPAIERINP